MNGPGQDDDGAATQPEDAGAAGALPEGGASPVASATSTASAESTPSAASAPSAAGTPAEAASGGNGAVTAAASATSATAAGSAPIVVRFAGRSVVGLVREHNEDNFVIANLATGDRHPRDATFVDEVGAPGIMFTVCDGMGGAAAGEVASRMAVDILHEALRRGGAPADRDTLARRLVSAVEEAGKRIYDAAQKERSRRGMGTTSTAAVLVDKILFIAEVGDSRAYLVRRGQMKQLTKDQSLVNQLIEAGHLTEAEAEAFEHSNIILQALGTAETVQVDLTFVELRKGDRLMMCSDGLSGLVHADVLRETLVGVADPAECATKLIEFAEAAGGHDNITVVVANFEGDGLEEAKDTDSFGYVQYPLPLGADESAAFTDEETTASGMEPTTRAPGAPQTSVLDRPSSSTWLAVGGVALVFAIGAWFMAESRERPKLAPSDVTDVVPEAEATPPPEPEAPKAVVVNVHTDVEHATLLVNGESRGELVQNEIRHLELPPGAYKFEAQAEGNPVAQMLIDVRGETPMDVFLQLPSGTNTAAAPSAEPAPEEAAAPTEPTEVAAPAPEAVPVPAEVAAPAPAPAPRAPSAPTEVPPAVAVRTPRPPRPPKPRPAVTAPPSEPGAPTGIAAPPPPPKDIPENPF